jgi:hypothetical protein
VAHGSSGCLREHCCTNLATSGSGVSETPRKNWGSTEDQLVH